MKRPRKQLRTTFLVASLPVIFCVLALGAYSLITFSAIHKQLAGIREDISPNTEALLEMKALLTSLEEGLRKENLDRQSFARTLQLLKKKVGSHPNQQSDALNASSKTAHDMIHHSIRTMSLSQYALDQLESGWQGGEKEETLGLIQQELEKLGQALDDHLAIHLQEMTKAETFVSRKYQQTLLVVAGAGIAVMLLAVLMLIIMVRAVLTPLKILEEGVRQIGAGNLECTIQIATGDEFSYLAAEFEQMAKNLADGRDRLDLKVKERTKELLAANRELEKTEHQIHQLSQELLRVQESERQRIALDLHDNVAQELSALKVSGKIITKALLGGKNPDIGDLRDWEQGLDRCIKTVRELAYNLRPPGLEQLGLLSTLADYCREFSQRTGLVVRFSQVGCEKLHFDFQTAINLFRIIQEALNNTVKHAEAHESEVKFLYSHPYIIVRINDDGRGFDPDGMREEMPHRKRLGLLGMRERVDLLAGRLQIRSTIGGGTHIKIEVPVGEDRDGEETRRNS